MSDEKQQREVAAKFARDAIRLIERGKPIDVCGRKIMAASVVLLRGQLANVADELTSLRLELEETAGAAKVMIFNLQAALNEKQVELDGVKSELEGMKAQLSALGNGGRT